MISSDEAAIGLAAGHPDGRGVDDALEVLLGLEDEPEDGENDADAEGDDEDETLGEDAEENEGTDEAPGDADRTGDKEPLNRLLSLELAEAVTLGDGVAEEPNEPVGLELDVPVEDALGEPV